MEESPIRNMNDLLQALAHANSQLGIREIWWRGHAMASWKLRPSVYRKSEPERHESARILRFMKRARTRHPNCPTDKDRAAWLFFMQHYGLPTRLLDWTESVLIAAFFAVPKEEHLDEPGALWALNPGKLNEYCTGRYEIATPKTIEAGLLYGAAWTKSRPAELQKIAQAVSTPFSGRLEDDGSFGYREAGGGRFVPFFKSVNEGRAVMALLPDEVDVRMQLQLSVFTLHADDKPLEEMPDREQFLVRFEIPADAKKTLREELYKLGIRVSTLFPDLEHLAEEVATLEFDGEIPESQLDL